MRRDSFTPRVTKRITLHLSFYLISNYKIRLTNNNEVYSICLYLVEEEITYLVTYITIQFHLSSLFLLLLNKYIMYVKNKDER